MKGVKKTMHTITSEVKSKTQAGAVKMKKNILTLKDRAAANMEAFLKARKNKLR